MGFITGDGKAVKKEELSQEEARWFYDYSVLNYCGMTDLFDQVRPFYCAE